MKSAQQGKKIRVVLDTNIIISAAISEEGAPARIFELLILELIENFTSEDIVEEIEEVFQRRKIADLISEEDKAFVINNYKKFSTKVKPVTKIDKIKEDSEDNKFLEVAVTVDADFIISGDAHLKQIKSYGNIRILTPKEFIEEIFSD